MASASIAIPTRGRSDYLRHTLAGIVPQAREHDVEIVVVLDGPDPATAALAERHGARVVTLPERRGANAARNAALEATTTDVVIFCDDDVEAPPGWLAAHLNGLAAYPDHGVLGGPIRPRLDDGPVHCGAEPGPITSLELGPEDRDTDYVWSANLALRRSAITRVGPFDPTIHGRGEEEELQDRLHAAEIPVGYLAGAGLIHRRAGADARVSALARADYRLGASARANDVRKGTPPTLARELRDLAGALWHAGRRRCGYGLVFAAHAVGRIQETLDPTPSTPAPGEFTSGRSGYVAGTRALSTARIADALADTRGAIRGWALDADALAWATPARVLVLSLERDDVPNILDAALEELGRSIHHVDVVRRRAGERGRFENLNLMLEDHADDLAAADWLIVLDDDVRLPAGFLDRFIFLAQRHGLALAQPAHRRLSHAAWPVTRRRAGSVLRETAFVEIGPLVAFSRRTFSTLLPFPDLRYGWGLDAHWAAVAAEHGWRLGVVDSTPISHALRPVAASYDQSSALAESRAFLAEHAHITPKQPRSLQEHRSW